MDIHKPKPWHGVREFVKEYAIIVVGVLTALAAEQTVEALHHRGEVRVLRRALDQELAWNLASMKDLADAYPCTSRRLDELQTWSKASETGHPLKLIHRIDAPRFFIFRNAVWHSATSSTLDHMPAEARIDYANFYAGVENNQALRRALLDGWKDLSPFEAEPNLTHEDRVRIAHDINDIRYAAANLAYNYPMWRDVYAPSLGVRAATAFRDKGNVALEKAVQTELCKPLLAQTA